MFSCFSLGRSGKPFLPHGFVWGMAWVLLPVTVSKQLLLFLDHHHSLLQTRIGPRYGTKNYHQHGAIQHTHAITATPQPQDAWSIGSAAGVESPGPNARGTFGFDARRTRRPVGVCVGVFQATPAHV